MKNSAPPAVSIIVPVFNAESYIDQCLASLLTQTLDNIEIIIVDDGSQDESLKVIQQYQKRDRRVEVVSSPMSSGSPGIPRNRALEMARGEYVGFVDSDDWVDPVAFQFLYEAALEGDLDVVLAEGYWEERGHTRTPKVTNFEKVNMADKHDIFARYKSLVVWDKLFKRSFLVRHNIRLAETEAGVDVPFVILALLLSERTGYACGCHYHYRIGVASSTSDRKRNGMYSHIFDVYEITKRRMISSSIYDEFMHLYTMKRINSMLFLLSQIENRESRIQLRRQIRTYFGTIDQRAFYRYLKSKRGARSVNRRLLRSGVYSIHAIRAGIVDYLQHWIAAVNSAVLRRVKWRARHVLARRIPVLRKAGGMSNWMRTKSKKVVVGEEIRNHKILKESRIIKPGCANILTSSSTPRIILSLTSYPPRIGTLHLCIQSLLKQRKKPDKILLWLATEQFPEREDDLPRGLVDLKKYGLSICWCEDLKSYKKLVPIIRDHFDDVVITADDDVFYSRKMVERLYFSYLADPESIHCDRGREVAIGSVSGFSPYRKWRISTGAASSSFRNIPTGVGGVLYPPHSLHPDVTKDELFLRLAPTNDDLWFWTMGVLNDRKVTIVEGGDIWPRYISGTQKVSLWENYNRYGEIDAQLANIARHYPVLKQKLEKSIPLADMVAAG